MSEPRETTVLNEHLIISSLEHPGFRMLIPIAIAVSTEADGYLLSNDELNVHAFGKSMDETRRTWERALVDLYCSYRDTPDEQLTPAALTLKKRFQSSIEEC